MLVFCHSQVLLLQRFRTKGLNRTTDLLDPPPPCYAGDDQQTITSTE